MAVHIALLRAVNVGGTGKVAMADLKALAAGLGFGDARTYVNSGNLLFLAPGKSSAEVEALLEAEAKAKLGLATDFVMRTPAEIRATIAANPFPQEAADMPSRLLVGFGKRTVDAEAAAALEAATEGLAEKLAVVGREVFSVYPDGAGRSLLSPRLIKIERTFPSTRATARNWNTVRKLEAMATEMGG